MNTILPNLVQSKFSKSLFCMIILIKIVHLLCLRGPNMNEEPMIDNNELETNNPALPQQLELLRQALEGFLKQFSSENTLSDIVYDLNNQYDILEETLATVVNWLALHKSIIRAMGIMEKLTEPSILSQPEDEVKKTIRTGPNGNTMK